MRSFYSLSLIFLLLLSCRGPRYAANNVVDGSIPADITNPNYILLVELPERSIKFQRNLLAKTMKEYYPAAYEIVSPEDLEAEHKYRDVNKYRYLVTLNEGSGGSYTVRSSPNPAISNTPSSVSYSDQIVHDRKENKTYPATGLMGHNYAQGMMLFSQVLDKKKSK